MKDGSIKWVRERCNTHYAEDGTPLRSLGTTLDITEHKTLLDSQRKFQKVIEEAGEAVLITDQNAIIEYVNPAFTEVTGYLAEEVIGNTPKILKSSAQDPSFYKELWETITDGKVWHGTLIDRKKDGSFYPALTSISPVHDEHNEITHFVSLQQDMTEHKKLEGQLLQAQKMEAIGTLVGGIAHDFNNMLAAIQGNVYLSKLHLEEQPEIRNRLDNIENLGNRGADMVRQLLTFARKDMIKMKPLSLNSFMKEGFKLAKSAIPESIEHTCNICQEDLVVNGDATQLQQALMNLLNNAAYAVNDAPTPQITCSLSRYLATDDFISAHPDLHDIHFAKLEVRDNGCGITNNHLDKIFEPFFTTKNVGEGTGLGLAMVYGAMQSHEGTIEAISETGVGTTFNIYLPLKKVASPQIQKSDAEIHGQGETVLLVDDEPAMRETTSEVLESLGYVVLIAKDGEEALETFKTHKKAIDIILTDMVMPKMSGMELAKAIRNLGHNIPIIFATGYDKGQVFSASDHIEHSETIGKPFSFKELSHMIPKLIYSE